MFEIILALFTWLPPVVQILFAGVLIIFVVWVIVKIIIVVMEIIPFV